MSYEEIERSGECPWCYGPVYVLGQLGNTIWLRCRNCGADCSEQAS